MRLHQTQTDIRRRLVVALHKWSHLCLNIEHPLISVRRCDERYSITCHSSPVPFTLVLPCNVGFPFHNCSSTMRWRYLPRIFSCSSNWHTRPSYYADPSKHRSVYPIPSACFVSGASSGKQTSGRPWRHWQNYVQRDWARVLSSPSSSGSWICRDNTC